MTRTRCLLFLASLAAGCGNANADVIVRGNDEPPGTPSTGGGAGEGRSSGGAPAAGASSGGASAGTGSGGAATVGPDGGDGPRTEQDGGAHRGGGPGDCTTGGRCDQSCSTSSDCRSDKQPFCDAVAHVCVECRTSDDCSEGENPTCVAGQCTR